MSTIFQRIIDGEIPAQKVFEDDDVLAFRDVDPKAPFHVLVIPKKPIASLAEAGPDDGPLLGKLLLVAAKVAKEAGLEGYRVVTNIGDDGGQSVLHLHLHVMGGRKMRWPPG
jgi:histidine triad (HIT) family protein